MYDAYIVVTRTEDGDLYIDDFDTAAKAYAHAHALAQEGVTCTTCKTLGTTQAVEQQLFGARYNGVTPGVDFPASMRGAA